MRSIEFCAGAGGQALGLEQAGFQHEALVEIEPDFAKTLRLNRPQWNVHAQDMNQFDGRPYRGVELLTAGLPCPPFSVAGKQLGDKDERNLTFSLTYRHGNRTLKDKEVDKEQAKVGEGLKHKLGVRI